MHQRSRTRKCVRDKEVTTFLTEAMGATPSQIGYVRKGAARGLTKVGVRLLPSLARSPASAMWWLSARRWSGCRSGRPGAGEGCTGGHGLRDPAVQRQGDRRRDAQRRGKLRRPPGGRPQDAGHVHLPGAEEGRREQGHLQQGQHPEVPRHRLGGRARRAPLRRAAGCAGSCCAGSRRDRHNVGGGGEAARRRGAAGAHPSPVR